MKNALRIVLCIVAFSIEASAQFYTAIDLGTIGGTYAQTAAINNSGTIVGDSFTSGNLERHAFSYSNGVMTDLGTLGGSLSQAFGINDSGVIVGTSPTSGYSAYRAFSYSGGVMTDLGANGGTDSRAKAISSVGTIVGYFTNNGATHAFSYSGGVMADLGTLGGQNSWAYDVNTAGTVVGTSNTLAGPTHAFSFSNGVMTDLGFYGEARAINEAGKIVGTDGMNAFIFNEGVKTTIGTLGGTYAVGTDINNFDLIVGASSTNGGGEYRAFIYQNGIMTDLNTITNSEGGILDWAYGINDSGYIVANSVDGRAYLLIPTSTAPITLPSGGSAVPEPSTYAVILGACVLGFVGYRRHRPNKAA